VAAISSSRNRRPGRWRRHFSMSTQRAAAFNQKERNRKAKTSAKSVRNSEFDNYIVFETFKIAIQLKLINKNVICLRML